MFSKAEPSHTVTVDVMPVPHIIGVGTGEEFVWNIQTADRMIWTAIGNTTNLSASQAWHPGLASGSGAVPDLGTWERAQAAAAAARRGTCTRL